MSKMKPFFFKIILIILAFFFWIFVLLNLNSVYQKSKTEDFLFENIDDVPNKKVGLVLGTSKFLGWEKENKFYKKRIDAAYKLWKKQKVSFFILSGDNSQESYNEPQMMKNDLVKLGVPKERIYLDFAGFRTYDSVIRAKDVFGEDDFIIISQKSQISRALFIADYYNIKAIGFSAGELSSLKFFLREMLAKFKTTLDIYLLNTKPKFSGDMIEIEIGKPQFD